MSQVRRADLAAIVKGEPIRAELAAVLAPLLGVPVWTLTCRQPRVKRHVFVILAALHEPFQKALGERLPHYLDKQGLTYGVQKPQGEFLATENRRLLMEVTHRHRAFDGGIIVAPTWTPEEMRQVWAFAEWLGKPVLVVDRNPPLLEKKWPSNLTYVGFRDYRGGWLAGQFAAKRLSKKPRSRQTAIVMTGSVKHQRAAGGIEAIEAYRVGRAGNSPMLPAIEELSIGVETGGDYTQGTAASKGFDLMVEALERRAPVEAAFATSSLMAEGLADAAEELVRRFGCSRPDVVGYDFGSLMEGRVHAAVVQDVDLLAMHVAEEMMRRLCQGSPRRQLMLSPRLTTAWAMLRSSEDDPLRREVGSEMLVDCLHRTAANFEAGNEPEGKKMLAIVNSWVAQGYVDFGADPWAEAK